MLFEAETAADGPQPRIGEDPFPDAFSRRDSTDKGQIFVMQSNAVAEPPALTSPPATLATDAAASAETLATATATASTTESFPYLLHSASAPPIPGPHVFAADMSTADRDDKTRDSPQHGISFTVQGDAAGQEDPRPLMHGGHMSAPPTSTYKSPLRHHKRTPSAHREVKETLNARSEYTSDDVDGRSHHRINQYTIKEEIGRGSYGAVHLAVDQYGIEFAVKEFSKARLRKRAQSNILRHGPRRPHRFSPSTSLNAPLGAAPIGGQKFAKEGDALFLIREEIAIMKKLNHPNLVQLIEVLDDPEEDSLYMVLEMCKKGVVMKVGLDEPADPYDEENCRCWLRDLILGIEYLHHQGVVHRDIKPDNLLLTEDDVLKVVDFGVSEMFEKPDQMMTAKSAGSPAFLPPELCVAKHGDISGAAADIWSMGVSLYCLRYGKIPFDRTGVLEMYEAIKTEVVQLPEDESEDFVDLITRMLDKDPNTRIKMPELREHVWVTRHGSDPLLSAEENCTEVVGTPDALEVQHAVTQKMSHLLVVLRAIQKFKGLLQRRSQPPTPRLGREAQSAPALLDSETQVRTQPQPTTVGQSVNDEERPLSGAEKTNAEHAAALIAERHRFLQSRKAQGLGQDQPEIPHLTHHHRTADGSYLPHGSGDSRSSSHGSRGHAHDPTDIEPLYFGIGTGVGPNSSPGISINTNVSGTSGPGSDSRAGSGSKPEQTGADAGEADGVVSDSPTAVDFNVYDRAYEAEVHRIREQSGGRSATMFLTRHVYETGAYHGDDQIAGGGGGGGSAGLAMLRGLQSSTGNKFANLVSHMKEGKDATAAPPGSGMESIQ